MTAATSAPAAANIGVPMLMLVLPGLGLLFVPIVLIEGLVGARATGLPFRKTWLPSLTSNLLSTLVGVPVTWGIMVIPQLAGLGAAQGLDTEMDKVYAVTVQSAWLTPYEGDLHWMVPAACITLCVPFCLMSIWLEGLVLRRKVERRLARKWALLGNVTTYGMIELILLVLLLTAHP